MVLGEYCVVARHLGFRGKADAGDVGNDPRRAFVHPPFLPDFGQHIFFHRVLTGKQMETDGRQTPNIRCSGFLPSVMYR